MLKINFPIICPNPKCGKINEVRETFLIAGEGEKKVAKNWRCKYCKKRFPFEGFDAGIRRLSNGKIEMFITWSGMENRLEDFYNKNFEVKIWRKRLHNARYILDSVRP